MTSIVVNGKTLAIFLRRSSEDEKIAAPLHVQ
jgi:hypothetical protein